MREEDIPDLTIFMMCERLHEGACSDLPAPYHFRNCRPVELEPCKTFPFDAKPVR